MIHSEEEYKTTLERITYFQKQVEHLREAETNPENYRLSAAGFLAELDRMVLEVREFLWSLQVNSTKTEELREKRNEKWDVRSKTAQATHSPSRGYPVPPERDCGELH